MKPLILFATIMLTGCSNLGCMNRGGIYLGEEYGYSGGYCMMPGEPLRKRDMRPTLGGRAKDTRSMMHNYRSKAFAMRGFRYGR